MKGFLKKRSERSYSIVIYLGRDPVSGKKQYKWHTVDGNKKHAEAELARLLHELNTGAYVNPSKDTTAMYLSRWLETVKSGLAGKTFERYQEIVNRHLIPAFGMTPLAKLQPMQIQNYYSRALLTGRLDGKGGLSAQTVLHHHRVLSEALQASVKWQLLARNPAAAVEPPRVERKEMHAADEDQSAWLLTAAEGTRLYIPILLALTTGIRRGEILAVRWEDMNLDAGTLSVRRSLEETREGLRFKEPKGKRGRLIELPDLTVEALLEHRQRQHELKRLLGSQYEDNGLVCSYEDGSIWKPESFTALYFSFAERIGIKLRFHDLRHSHASHLLKAGVHPKVVSERLGHSTVAITLDLYSHLLPGVQQEAARRVDSALRTALDKRRNATI